MFSFLLAALSISATLNSLVYLILCFHLFFHLTICSEEIVIAITIYVGDELYRSICPMINFAAFELGITQVNFFRSNQWL
jgi:hypothetical protein